MPALTLNIDPEIAGFLRVLSEAEYKHLEQNCIENGILDPVIVWDEGGVVVDGHNRYRIANEHGLQFEVTKISFGDLDEVKEWISQRQVGRRNLQVQECAKLCKNYLQDNPDATPHEIGKEIGASTRQVQRVLESNKVISEYFPEDIKKRIAAGNLVAPIRTIKKIDELEPEDREKVWKKLRENPKCSLQHAVPSLKKKPALNDQQLELVGTLSPSVQQRIATGKLEAPPVVVKKIKTLPEAKRKAIDDILVNEKDMTLQGALDVVYETSKNKGKSSQVDKARLKNLVDKKFGDAMQAVDEAFSEADLTASDEHGELIDQLKHIRDRVMEVAGK